MSENVKESNQEDASSSGSTGSQTDVIDMMLAKKTMSLTSCNPESRTDFSDSSTRCSNIHRRRVHLRMEELTSPHFVVSHHLGGTTLY